MATVAIYPGSFDPITYGHLDLIQRAAMMFDRVWVAVARDTEKKSLFTVEERIALTQAVLRGYPRLRGRVDVESFSGLLVNYARRRRATIVVRGLRAVSDFEFELQMALMNRKLNAKVETIFLMPKDEYVFISSRSVKEVAALGGAVSAFVPRIVEKSLQAKFRSR